MSSQLASPRVADARPQSARVYYLDWLRVIAILIVFAFHAVHPFDLTFWHVKNAEQSLPLTIVLVLLSLWGMAFFFLVAGSGSWFALQHRTPRQYLSERFKRLLVPFLVGSVIFSPLILACEWGNRTQLGQTTLSLPAYAEDVYRWYLGLGISPQWVGVGYHLWFLAFLFLFALVTLPLFQWLKGEAGRRVLSTLAGWCEHRGALLIGILPLLVVQLAVRPFSPKEHGWGDFLYQMSFFALGYLIFADERLTRAVRRDWPILLSVGTLVVLAFFALYGMGYPIITWGEDPTVPQFYLIQTLVAIVAFCYSLTMLWVGMRWLNVANRWLAYAQQAVLPFFIVHQPVIVLIAFFVVQWNASIAVKLPVVVVSSFLVSVGLYEFLIRRWRPLQIAFGVKPGPRQAVPETTVLLTPRPG